jgi:hypothetical protein
MKTAYQAYDRAKHLKNTSALLCGNGLTRRARRNIMRSRDKVCPDLYDKQEPKRSEVKLALKLQSLPLLKVQSFARRFARRASTVSHILPKLSPDSPFRPTMELNLQRHLSAHNQAQAELAARAEHAAKS